VRCWKFALGEWLRSFVGSAARGTGHRHGLVGRRDGLRPCARGDSAEELRHEMLHKIGLVDLNRTPTWGRIYEN
jgi:hypothetical protein